MRIERSAELQDMPARVWCGAPSFYLEKPPMTPPKNLGMLLLAIWLILFGMLTSPFLGVSFSHSGDILGVLAIVAGVLLVMQR